MLTSPWYLKVIGITSISGFLLAQEMPVDLNWAKYPLDVLCIGALFWIATRTIPNLVKEAQEQQRIQREAHEEQTTEILNVHKAAMTELSTTLSNKIDVQTTAISAAIRGTAK